MKKIILAITTSLALTTAQATELKSFKHIAKAVGTGKRLTYVLKFSKCQASFPANNLVSSVKPSAFMVIKDKRVTASYQHFSLNQPGAPGEPTIAYGKYDIYADGKADIQVTLMKATDYSKIKEYTMHCELGHGLTVFK